MVRKLKVFDTTLRDGEQAPGFSMDLREKLDVSWQLELMRVDVIEAGFAASSPGDFAAVRAVAGKVKDCAVASFARCVEKDIDAAFDALRPAVSPRIHVCIATSPLHMEHKLHMTPEEVLSRIERSVRHAKKLVSDVQFSAEDACRSDPDFLCRCFEAAIRCGATTVNIPDTVGYVMPWEMERIVRSVMERTAGIEKVDVAVHCHDDLGFATANTIAGLHAGAVQAEVTINGIGERAGNAALEEVVMTVATRSAELGLETGVDTRRIYRTSRLVENVTGTRVQPNKAIVGRNAFSHEAGIHQHGMLANRATYEIVRPESIGMPKASMVLGKHSGRHAFEERMQSLGYDLAPEELDRAFERFKALCDRKKNVSDRDLEALVGARETEHPGRYAVRSFVINSGNKIDSTAVVNILRGAEGAADAETLQGVALGSGPVDAAFKAINIVVGREFVLESYQLRSVTEGEDALGEAVVRISLDGKTVVGRGISTDVIEASIKAYVAGINKCYSESV